MLVDGFITSSAQLNYCDEYEPRAKCGQTNSKIIDVFCSQKWSLNRGPPNKRVPKLPMAKNTARIIQKGIIYEPIDHIAKWVKH